MRSLNEDKKQKSTERQEAQRRIDILNTELEAMEKDLQK